MRTSDWAFVLGLPTTKREFRYARAVGEYCIGDESIGYRDWDDYKNRFLSHFEQRVVPLEQRLGLRVLRAATARTFGKQLQGARGVILFSHCDFKMRKIEFADGMKSYEEVADHVSASFHGIVDVSACAPVGFDQVLKERASSCAVKAVNWTLNPAMWFLFYARFLLMFAKSDCAYATALLDTTKLFREAATRNDVANLPAH